MAGNLNSPSVIWNVGDTTGRNVAGAATALPVAPNYVYSGTAAPTAAPTGGTPIYWDTDTTDNLYIWIGTAWVGPYNKGT